MFGVKEKHLHTYYLCSIVRLLTILHGGKNEQRRQAGDRENI